MIALIQGHADADDLAWLQRGLALSFRENVPLEVALKLPSTPARRRKAMRDYWLMLAAAACSEREPWRRACELALAGRVFEERVWCEWRHQPEPPTGASALEVALFYLYASGGRVPRARRVLDLIAMVDADIAVISDVASVS